MSDLVTSFGRRMADVLGNRGEELAREQGFSSVRELDAFRHAYSNAMLARYLPDGDRFARLVGDYIELSRPNNVGRDKYGDLINNSIGREIGKTASNEAEIAERVAEALRDGSLVKDYDTDPRTLPENFPSDLLPRGFLDAIEDNILAKALGFSRFLNDLYLEACRWINYSPMVLDLDGDGIETLGADNSNAILFDHDGDGIKTGTGWIKADDALLVLDRNGNGTIDNGAELFGVDTVLANGHRAADGYVAMRELDSNGDGVLNSSDARYADLKIWRDLNQDGESQANELQSLNQAGIASLSLTATPEGDHLLPGWNWQTLSSTYTRTDGSTATLADINFADNGFYRQFPDQLDTTAVQDLPAMAGSGLVRDLQEAATLSTGLQEQLRTLQAQGYVDRQTYLDQIKQIIDAWADTSRMDTATERTGLTTEEIRLLGTGTATSTGLHYIEATGNQIGDTQGYTIDILYRPDGVEGDLIKLEAGHMGVGSDYTRINALTDAQKAEQIAKWERVTYLIEVLERYNGMPFIDILPDKVTSVAGQFGKVSRGGTARNEEWRKAA